MADTNRITKLSLEMIPIEKIKQAGYKFSFEQCVHILMKTYPNYRFVFESANRCYLSGNEVKQVEISENTIKIVSDRMSLTSLNSPLPDTYLDVIKVCQWNKNYSVLNFLGIFQHRLTSLSYEISKKRKIAIQPSEYVSDIDRVLQALSSLGNDFSYLIHSRPRTVLALRQILKSLFKCDVIIEQFCGRFYPLNNVSILGQKNNILGETYVIGRSFSDRTASIKILIYNLDNDIYLKYFIDKVFKKNIDTFIQEYIGFMLDFELHLLPKSKTATYLNATRYLGESTWLKT